MKVYLVSRIDKVDYDEFNAAVVVAANEDDAVALAVGDGAGWAGNGAASLKVEPVGDAEDDEARVVLRSFNAG